MGLRVAVIGRGREGEVYGLENDHSLYCYERAYLSETPRNYRKLDSFHFVIQHLGPDNDEARGAIDYWRSNGWGHKVIGVTGHPHVPQDFADLGLETFVLSTRVEDLRKLRWDLVPGDYGSGSGEDSHELFMLLTNACQSGVLNAVAVLCQGFMANWALNNPDMVSDIATGLEKMGWYDLCTKSSGINERKEMRTDAVSTLKWWRIFGGRLRSEIEADLARHGLSLDIWPGLKELVGWIETSGEQGNGTIAPRLVGVVYLELFKILGKERVENH